jgi:hypothetical protein
MVAIGITAYISLLENFDPSRKTMNRVEVEYTPPGAER